MAVKSLLAASLLFFSAQSSAIRPPPPPPASGLPLPPPPVASQPATPPRPPVGGPAVAAPGGQIKCPVVFSGQIPTAFALTDFDSATTSLFNPNNVKGNDSWSQIIQFPAAPAPPASPVARFDDPAKHKSLEVIINDKSIFKTQNGFRRAGLLFKNDTNTPGAGNTGVKTLHWSVRQDLAPGRAMNLSHEYLNVWHERGDFAGNQFNFEAGTLLTDPTLPKDTFKFLNLKNELIFQTPINFSGEWQNFAVTMDFDNNTLQVFSSIGSNAPLVAVTGVLANDNSGAGQFQMGMLKKPTGTADVVNSGFQESGISEGQIYGGIFLEDSKGGCVSL